MNKEFKITFSDNAKYNPVTRTIIVYADNRIIAERLTISEHGSFTKDKKTGLEIPSKKITITKVKEIKEKKKKEDNNKNNKLLDKTK